jgi:predicted  nucleic acid-binding Zn-ribbon protein
MKSLEKDLNPELFAKYKAIKNDKIFPVFVSFANGNCSGCRVEIPTSKINKLKSEGSIVCEQCHRIIYYK